MSPFVYNLNMKEQLARLCQELDYDGVKLRSLLHDGKHQDLLDYIAQKTAFLEHDKLGYYKFRTKLWHAMNGYDDFVECQNENCHEKIHRNIVTLKGPCMQFCSSKCRYSAQQFKEKVSIGQKSLTPEAQQRKSLMIKQTKKERYGDSSYNNHAKTVETLQKRYGKDITNIFQTAQAKEKIRKTTLERYGTTSYSKTDECKEKKAKTCLERYGVTSPSQDHRIRTLQQKNYHYDGICFDSAPEIAFYIWLVDNKKEFKYQPTSFSYVYEGKERRYFPDFEVEGQLIELKGEQFLSKDGKWICPWNHSLDAMYEAKRQCALANDVRIMYPSEYDFYVEYVYKKHRDRSFLKKLRNK